MTKKIDITSTLLEKGVDIAKDFLDKLIFPAVEETGLLLREKVTLWKFKNQVRMLNKAKEYCEKNNISTKTISLKLLCPLLDGAALEEDEVLQDKWAILLTNLADSEQNIENHVFPYILGQISTKEFNMLNSAVISKQARVVNLKKELDALKNNFPHREKEIRKKIEESKSQISEINDNKENSWLETFKLERRIDELKYELRDLGLEQRTIQSKIYSPEIIPDLELREFEISNLIRLGLIKYVQNFFANSQTLEIPYEFDEEYRGRTTYSNVDLEVNIQSDEKYILTELGELFINACTEKQKNHDYN